MDITPDEGQPYDDRIGEPVDLSAFEAELLSDPLIGSVEEALHLWLAAGQVLFALQPPPVMLRMRAAYPDLMDPEQVSGMFAEVRESENEEMRDKLLDKLGDFAKTALRELAEYFGSNEMPDAAFLVFLPCHMGNGTLTLKDKETGLPKLRVW